VESVFGLTRGHGAPPEELVTQASCYETFITGNDSATKYEFRRYDNGAVFFAKKGSGESSGDSRPIVCVDVYQKLSLSGAALDAVIRYNLGAYQGGDSAMMHRYMSFERGGLEFFVGMPPEELRAKARTALFEQSVGSPATVNGILTGVTMQHGFRLDPEHVDLAYRVAWRAAADQDSFSLQTDPVGAYVNGLHQGDAVWMKYGHGTLTAGTDGDKTWMKYVVDGAPESSAPMGECSRTGTEDWHCTGI
jgi:hypothetical protein